MTLTHTPIEQIVQQWAARAADGPDAGGDATGDLVHLERLPPRPARHGELTHPVPDAVQAAFGHRRLWTHQATAIDLARAGRSVVVATGTASGKSLCYQMPIAEAVLARPQPGSALLLFPTKALAHDQLRAFGDLDLPGLTPACYDGDAGPEERAWMRRNANVLLTNPEMLHHGILPNHPRWTAFLSRLRYVVIDELHVLRGVFGSHVSHLLRRLRRLANRYGAEPTFIFTSATIGEPATLASALCGLDVVAVDDDGAPRGERWFALWNPPLDDAGARGSSHREAASLLAGLVDAGHRSIAFTRSRRMTEVVAADTRRHLDGPLASTVRSYRGGYLADERREIERELADGEARAVVATTALELGVDIGGLDACLLDGFPGTIASMWQQAGRAGREAQHSLAVLVAGDDQLDQYLMAHPHEVFQRPPEPAVINPANPYVLLPHLACASYEKPLTLADERYWPGLLDDGVRQLVLDDRLRVRRRRGSPVAVWDASGLPAHGVSFRSGGGGEIRIVDGDGSLVGTVDRSRATSAVHPGAIYLHRGDAWQVDDLDLATATALVSRHDGGEYTQARSEVDLRVLDTEQSVDVGRSHLHLGTVEVTTQVTGYRRRDVLTGELLANEELDLPPSHLVTRAFWYTVRPEVLHEAGLGEEQWPGTLHATEHAAIGILPLFTICDRWDVGGVSTALQADTLLPSVFIYDGQPGGAGIAELGYRASRRHLETTLEVVTACSCERGCPSCVQSPKCGNGNDPLDKDGAAALLRMILAG
jgi:DEAD/DEAH box helicase domain-containing protein